MLQYISFQILEIAEIMSWKLLNKLLVKFKSVWKVLDIKKCFLSGRRSILTGSKCELSPPWNRYKPLSNIFQSIQSTEQESCDNLGSCTLIETPYLHLTINSLFIEPFLLHRKHLFIMYLKLFGNLCHLRQLEGCIR